MPLHCIVLHVFVRLGKQISAVTAADRERTKHVVYAVIYGVGKCSHIRVHACLSWPDMPCAGKERLGGIMQESPSVARELTNSFLGMLMCM